MLLLCVLYTTPLSLCLLHLSNLSASDGRTILTTLTVVAVVDIVVVVAGTDDVVGTDALFGCCQSSDQVLRCLFYFTTTDCVLLDNSLTFVLLLELVAVAICWASTTKFGL